ncbi:MAG: class I SAM-dependent methyltransferase [Ginsengibacter sp.]
MNCGSLERHRALWIFLKEQGELFNSQLKLLHVAPEKVYYKKFSSNKNISYYPIDLHPDNYTYGRKTIEMDVTRLNFPDEFFDAIICNHVLEHVVEDTKAMKEMYRVLKPGRWAILNVPIDLNREKTFEDASITDPQKRMELFHQSDHVRIYGKDYTSRLTCAGFQVETIEFGSKFSVEEQFKYGIKASELIFLCKK